MENNNNNDHTQMKKRMEAAIRKAEEGNLRSMLVVAYLYSGGEYVPKDYIAAEAWLRKAAGLGSDYAKKALAELLTNGKGLAQDFDEAFELYHELMLDCDLDGMVGVGMAYKYGKGIHKDEEKAAYFLRQAFEIELDMMRDDKGGKDQTGEQSQLGNPPDFP